VTVLDVYLCALKHWHLTHPGAECAGSPLPQPCCEKANDGYSTTTSCSSSGSDMSDIASNASDVGTSSGMDMPPLTMLHGQAPYVSYSLQSRAGPDSGARVPRIPDSMLSAKRKARRQSLGCKPEAPPLDPLGARRVEKRPMNAFLVSRVCVTLIQAHQRPLNLMHVSTH
jgi:hypothetical protein